MSGPQHVEVNMSRNRSWRRAQESKAKKKAREFLNRVSIIGNPTDSQVGKRASSVCSCSCFMCGNPRTYFGSITLQEERNNDYFFSECEDIIHNRKEKYGSRY